MKRYSKQVHEEAALICAIAASNYQVWNYFAVARDTGASKAALDLSYAAWSEVTDRQAHHDEDCHCEYQACIEAEAEALIRTGWSPK